MIWFNGFPFLDNKDEHSFGVPISHIMIQDLALIPSAGLQLQELGKYHYTILQYHALTEIPETLLKANTFQGFPIVRDLSSKQLIGFIGRSELKFAIG